jgi:hypothetical protein
MAKNKDTSDRDEKIKEASGTFGELKLMVTDYAKQQTVEPLKHLASWAIFGVVGAVLMTIGAFLLGLGSLRLFQKLDFTDGTWSFAPYMFVFVLLMICAGMCFWAMTRTPEWMDD